MMIQVISYVNPQAKFFISSLSHDNYSDCIPDVLCCFTKKFKKFSLLIVESSVTFKQFFQQKIQILQVFLLL